MKKLRINFKTLCTFVFCASLLFTGTLFAQGPQNLETKPEHFIFSEFVNGTALLKNGDKVQTFFNYNFLTQEMIYDFNGTKKALSKLQDIDTIFIDIYKFIPAGKVFYELALDSPITLFIQHKGRLNSKGNTVGYGGTSDLAVASPVTNINGSRIYDLSLGEFDIKNATLYWIRKDGVLYNVTNLKSVQKILPEKSSEIEKFIKERKINLERITDMKILTVYLNLLDNMSNGI